MVFTSLSSDVQNLLLTQFNFFFKFVLLFGFLAFACFYLFYWKPNKQQDTPFYSLAFIRLFLNTISWIYIFTFPLALFLMSPEFTAIQIQEVFYPIYLILVTLTGIGLVIDFIYFLPSVVVRMMGIDIKDKKVKKVYAMWNRYFKKNG